MYYGGVPCLSYWNLYCHYTALRSVCQAHTRPLVGSWRVNTHTLPPQLPSGETTGQVHRCFSGMQAAFLLQAYSQGLITRLEVLEVLDIAKTRFFALSGEYRRNPEAVTVSYQRTRP